MYSSRHTYLTAAMFLVSPATVDWADRGANGMDLLALAGEYRASGIQVHVFAHMLNVAATLAK